MEENLYLLYLQKLSELVPDVLELHKQTGVHRLPFHFHLMPLCWPHPAPSAASLTHTCTHLHTHINHCLQTAESSFLWTCRLVITIIIRCSTGSPDVSLLIFAIIPFFLLLQAPLRRCPSSSSVMVKRAGVAERLLALLRLLLPLRQPPPLPLLSCLLLCGIASSVANPAACG